jgi:enolase
MSSFKIKEINSIEILDSRGNPTVEVEVKTERNLARAAVPSGASTGIHEALELRDGDERRFQGKGVLKAVKNVNEVIAKKILGMDCREQEKIDNLMIKLDATKNKSRLGANAILGVSMAVARVASLEEGISLYEHIENLAGNKNFSSPLILPTPAMNIINGGKHAGNNLDIQEYMILPVGEKIFGEKVRICSEIYQSLKEVLKKKFGKKAINVGDEGGFAPPLEKVEEPLDLILGVIENLGYEDKVKLGLDCAASEFYNDKRGKYKIEGKELTYEKLMKLYDNLLESYPIISIEDPFAQDDWKSWVNFMKRFGDKFKIIGDDLLVTNVERIKKAIELEACNALLLKINQIGTISESIEAFKIAKENNWQIMVSHRSGETEDSFIADFSIGLRAEFIKAGAPCRGERTSKYNQLLRIWERKEKKCNT